VGRIQSVPENALQNEVITGRILKSLERIDAMIYHLLDVSIIKAGQKLPLHVEQVDLAAVIARIANEFNFAGPDRFFIKTPESLLGFWDEDGLTRIIENLATNALKYSDSNSPILISTESRGDQVKIIVHNDGKTITAEDQNMIFQPFSRAKTSEDKPGWGLGLTVVKSVAEAHGGGVKVESSEKLGTSFTVELPIDCRTNHSSIARPNHSATAPPH
jgi:signal transduction histidine kinase